MPSHLILTRVPSGAGSTPNSRTPLTEMLPIVV